MTDEKVRENRLRRVAERRGYRIEKSRRRDPRAFDFGGYMLIDSMGGGGVLLGGQPIAYGATLDQIGSYLDDEPPDTEVSKPQKRKARARK